MHDSEHGRMKPKVWHKQDRDFANLHSHLEVERTLPSLRRIVDLCLSPTLCSTSVDWEVVDRQRASVFGTIAEGLEELAL